MTTPLGSKSSRRRSRSTSRKLSGWEVLIAVLLVASVFASAVVFGGTTFWISGPVNAVAMAALLLWLGLQLAGKLREGMVFPPGSLVVTMVAGFVLVRSLVSAPVPYQAWTELYHILAFLLLYLGLAQLALFRAVWVWGSAAVLLLVSGEAVYALVQHVNESTDVLWLSRPEQYGMRASGSFICPNHFAQILQIGMLFGLGLLLMAAVPGWMKVICVYSVVVSVPALLLSGSRSAWIGTLAGIGCLVVLRAARHSWKRVVWTLVVFITGATVLCVSVYHAVPPVKNRVDHALKTGSLKNADIRTRALWPDSVRVIQGAGIQGTGPGTFRHVFSRYRHDFTQGNLYLRYAHNEYLHTLAEYGLWGSLIVFGGLLALLGRGVWRSLRSRSDSEGNLWCLLTAILFATAVHAIFDFNAHLPGNMYLLALLVALLTGRLQRAEAWHEVTWSRSWRSQTLFGCVFLAALGILLVSVPLTRASWTEFKIETARVQFQDEEVARLAGVLRDQLPSHWLGHRLLADEARISAFWCRNPELKETFVEQARGLYREALRTNPYDFPSHMGLVQLLRFEGERELVIEQLEELALVDPFNQQVQIQLGLEWKRLQKYDKALRAFNRAKQQDPRRNEQVEANIRELRKILKQSSERK